MFGSVDAVASYTHYNLPRTLAPLTPTGFSNPAAVPTTQDLFSAGIAYEVPLFTGFSQQRSVEIAQLQRELTDVAYTLGRYQLVYNVKSLYISILSSRSQYNAQRAYTDALQQLHDTIVYEIELGKRAHIERLKAAADLENARARLVQINSESEILKAGLAALMNVDRISELEPVLIEINEEKNDTIELSKLMRSRYAQIGVEQSAKAVQKSSAVYYPQIAFNAYYGQNFGPNDADNADSGTWNSQEVWQAGIFLKWNLYDFEVKGAKVQKAKLSAMQSRHERTITERELERALSEAHSKIAAALHAYRSADAEVAMTSEAQSIEEIRYENGAAQLNDLLYAKARHQLALSRVIDAKYRYQNSLYHLEYLLEKDQNK